MKIKPGDFIRHSTLLIWFEVHEVFSDFVTCADRDPAKGTELVFKKDIQLHHDSLPPGHYIKMNREKNFYDKFYPEGWHGDESKVIPFNDIKEGMMLIGTKGIFVPKYRKGNTWYCTGAQKTLTSKNQDSYVWHQIRFEGKE